MRIIIIVWLMLLMFGCSSDDKKPPTAKYGVGDVVVHKVSRQEALITSISPCRSGVCYWVRVYVYQKYKTEYFHEYELEQKRD